MNESVIVSLACFGAMTGIGWFVWITIGVSCISNLQAQIVRNRDKAWEERDKQGLMLTMLEQRIIELEKGKNK